MPPIQSLRYEASSRLHQMDYLTTQFVRNKVELSSMLARLITINTQLTAMNTRSEILEHRGALSSAFSKIRASQDERKRVAISDLASVLQTMNDIFASAGQLLATMSEFIGNIESNDVIQEYSQRIGPERFNEEYREWQRALDIVAQEVNLMSADLRVKTLQYKNCPENEYHKLHKAWSSTPERQEMDNLAALMLS